MAKAALDKSIKKGLRAAIYARYSSSVQTEQSIEGQLRDCYKTAEEQGLAAAIEEYQLAINEIETEIRLLALANIKCSGTNSTFPIKIINLTFELIA